MAIVAVFNIPGMNQAKYEKTNELLAEKNLSAPEGRLYHVAGPSEGGWLVIDTWNSPEDMGKFAESLIPILIAADIDPVPPTVYPAYNIIPG